MKQVGRVEIHAVVYFNHRTGKTDDWHYAVVKSKNNTIICDTEFFRTKKLLIKKLKNLFNKNIQIIDKA